MSRPEGKEVTQLKNADLIQLWNRNNIPIVVRVKEIKKLKAKSLKLNGLK